LDAAARKGTAARKAKQAGFKKEGDGEGDEVRGGPIKDPFEAGDPDRVFESSSAVIRTEGWRLQDVALDVPWQRLMQARVSILREKRLYSVAVVRPP
jgi:hypothetical protein